MGERPRHLKKNKVMLRSGKKETEKQTVRDRELEKGVGENKECGYEYLYESLLCFIST